MSNSPKGRILCLEDDSDSRDLITFVLRNEGYDVICIELAEEALKLAKAESFDLYLVNNWLPDASGVEFTKRLRKFDKQTPVLFYSAAGYESDKEAALKAGAQGYLVKPIGNEELLAEVIRLIAL